MHHIWHTLSLWLVIAFTVNKDIWSFYSRTVNALTLIQFVWTGENGGSASCNMDIYDCVGSPLTAVCGRSTFCLVGIICTGVANLEGACNGTWGRYRIVASNVSRWKSLKCCAGTDIHALVSHCPHETRSSPACAFCSPHKRSTWK